MTLTAVLASRIALAQAPEAPLGLGPGADAALPASAFRVLAGLPAGTSWEEVAPRFAAGGGGRPGGDVLDLGMTWQKLWAVAELANAGPGPASWQIGTELPAAGELEILAIRGGAAPERLLGASFRLGFGTRPVESRKLVSAPVAVQPGETVQLAVGYRPLGFSRLPLWLAGPAGAAAHLGATAQGDAVFYTATLAILACFTGFCLVMRNATGLWFAAMLGLNLAVVAQAEGQFFRWLWPEAPLFNLNATMPLILVAAAFGYLATLRAGRDSLGLRARTAIRAALAASLLHLAAVPFAHPVLVVPGGLVLWLGTFAAIAWSLPGWSEFSPLQRRTGLWVAVAVLAAGSVLQLAAAAGATPAWAGPETMLRLCYLAAGGGLMALLLMQVARLHHAHQAAMAAQIEASRKEAELSTALLQSERSYAEAMRRAARARQDLAAASHDLQQPLAALRLLLRQRAEDRTEEAVAEAMGYLDRLAGAFAAGGGTGTAADPAEAYDLGMVLRAAADMFRDEAEQRGIALDVSGAGILTRVPALAVMRIVSNLTVNAIRHSGGSRVSLMLAATPEEASVSVANDGAHMAPEAFARYLERGEKGPASEGGGLGLAIIAELCAENGLELSLDPSHGSGTRLTVTLPRASE